MTRQNAIRLTFVGLAVVVFDLIVGRALADRIYVPADVGVQRYVYVLFDDHWLRLAGAGIALLGAYLWAVRPKVS